MDSRLASTLDPHHIELIPLRFDPFASCSTNVLELSDLG